MKDTTLHTCFPFSHISMQPLPLISCPCSAHLPHSISSITLTNSILHPPLPPSHSPVLSQTSFHLFHILGIHFLAHLTPLSTPVFFLIYLPSPHTPFFTSDLASSHHSCWLCVHHTSFALFTLSSSSTPPSLLCLHVPLFLLTCPTSPYTPTSPHPYCSLCPLFIPPHLPTHFIYPPFVCTHSHPLSSLLSILCLTPSLIHLPTHLLHFSPTYPCL